MENRILHHYLEEFRDEIDVDPAEAETLFDALISSENEFLLANVLDAWCEKGFTDDELYEFASIMRRRMRKLSSDRNDLVDIVGTGGSKSKTFNVSTAAAFVIAGAGVTVAKHGNRAATSNSGSTDVLAELGINVDVDPKETEQCLADKGICFLFAPRFHSLSPTLAKARRSLGRPTIFNSLGPLCNPAGTPHHVIGVRNKELNDLMAAVLSRLGTGRSWVVTGDGDLDEISLTGKTHVSEVKDGNVRNFEVSVNDFGISSASGELPANCGPEESSMVIRSILNNEMPETAAENVVTINAAAAIYVAGRSESLSAAHEAAEASIRNGSALSKLDALVARDNA